MPALKTRIACEKEDVGACLAHTAEATKVFSSVADDATMRVGACLP